jgi:serine protease Do
MGIISAKGRADVGIVDYEDFIQTDAAINPGNSGGALVNMQGQLVGINTAILSRTGGNNGIGFAIPSNMAKPIMESLLKNGEVVRGYLGVVIQDINQEMARALHLKTSRGVLVADVQDPSPAAKAGIKRGDIILSVNGTATDSTGHLRNLVAAAGANSKVKLELMRKGSKQTLSVGLGKLPSQESAVTDQAGSSGGLSGLSLETLQAAHRSQLGLPDEFKSGVVVTGVQRGSTASRSLRPEDVIFEANRKPVHSPEELQTAFQANKGPVLLLVYRQGSTNFVTFNRPDKD